MGARAAAPVTPAHTLLSMQHCPASACAAAAGANLEVDVPWKYLNFFMEDDERLEEIGREYSSGRMLTGEIKAELVKVCRLHAAASPACSRAD